MGCLETNLINNKERKKSVLNFSPCISMVLPSMFMVSLDVFL